MKILLSGSFGFRNLGDEAILSVWAEKLRRHHQVYVISRNPAHTHALHGLLSFSRSFSGVVEALKKSEILFFPGGSLLQDRTSLRSLLFFAFQVFAAQKLRRKVFFYGQGLGPFIRKGSRALAMFCLRSAEAVTVRDAESQRLCQIAGIHAREVLDPAYMVAQENSLQGFHVLVPYREMARSMAIQKVFSDAKRINFLFSPLEDQSMFAFGPVATWRKITNPFSGAASCVCFRLHSAVFAHAAGIPFFVVMHDPKMKGWVEKTSWQHFGTVQDKHELLIKLKAFYGQVAEVQKQAQDQKEHFLFKAQADLEDCSKLWFGV